MTAIWRYVTKCSALTALCLCASAGLSRADPAWMIGSWTGIGSQSGTGSHWSIQLTVQRQSDGPLNFKIDYPSLNCGGYWALNSDELGKVSLTEHITYGREMCVDLGTISVTPYMQPPSEARVQQISFEWTGTQPDGKPDSADARLTRVP